jgi:hypothetical protein
MDGADADMLYDRMDVRKGLYMAIPENSGRKFAACTARRNSLCVEQRARKIMRRVQIKN